MGAGRLPVGVGPVDCSGGLLLLLLLVGWLWWLSCNSRDPTSATNTVSHRTRSVQLSLVGAGRLHRRRWTSRLLWWCVVVIAAVVVMVVVVVL